MLELTIPIGTDQPIVCTFAGERLDAGAWIWRLVESVRANLQLLAVARSFGHPSRVVNGVALWERAGRPMAAGHAWTEIHDGTAWRLADAAVLPEDRVLHLPLGVLEDEGPGYLLAMLGSLSPLDDVRRIEVCGGPAALIPPAPAALRGDHRKSLASIPSVVV